MNYVQFLLNNSQKQMQVHVSIVDVIEETRVGVVINRDGYKYSSNRTIEIDAT